MPRRLTCPDLELSPHIHTIGIGRCEGGASWQLRFYYQSVSQLEPHSAWHLAMMIQEANVLGVDAQITITCETESKSASHGVVEWMDPGWMDGWMDRRNGMIRWVSDRMHTDSKRICGLVGWWVAGRQMVLYGRGQIEFGAVCVFFCRRVNQTWIRVFGRYDGENKCCVWTIG